MDYMRRLMNAIGFACVCAFVCVRKRERQRERERERENKQDCSHYTYNKATTNHRLVFL